jgi:hypothetical protein
VVVVNMVIVGFVLNLILEKVMNLLMASLVGWFQRIHSAVNKGLQAALLSGNIAGYQPLM